MALRSAKSWRIPMVKKSAACVVAILGLLGCGDQNPVAPSITLEVYVVSGFQDELVDIAIDGTRVFSGTVGAQPLSGPVAALYTSQERGAHRLDVNVGAQEATSELVLTAPTYVLIERDEQTEKLRLTVTQERPLWI